MTTRQYPICLANRLPRMSWAVEPIYLEGPCAVAWGLPHSPYLLLRGLPDWVLPRGRKRLHCWLADTPNPSTHK